MTDNVKHTLQDGINVIKKNAATLGNTPGVYQMFDRHDQTLYVGKAKALKRRVTSYTQPNRLSKRIIKMVSLTTRMEFIQTHTEAEALLLEANLIKKKKPRYNILLKDDKSFPYILMEEAHPYPKLVKHRGAKNKKGQYFGPFASVGAVNNTLNIMQRVFMIRNCKDSDFENRNRPCLQYHIKRCTAPCVDYVSRSEYAAQVKDAKDYLSGKSRQIQERMAQEMEEASANLEFEKAAALRDRIRALSTIQNEQTINIPNLPDTDVVVGALQGDRACVQVFFFRTGQNFGNRTYYPQVSGEDTLPLLLSNFIAQFYRNKPMPKEILMNHEAHEQNLLQEALSQNVGYKVTLKDSTRGERRKLVDWAEQNLQTQFTLYLQTSRNEMKALTHIAELFGMDELPQRIEIYDNSHISGSNMVGGMVVAGRDGLMKNQYRKFNMKDANAQDDFDMMREVMRRRFSRAIKENRGPGTDTWPDLLLIDGGKGQLSAVTEVLKELDILDKLTLVAISKGPDRNAGREEFHMNGRPSFRLPEKDSTLFYLQRLRDEAHRFAIGAHRTRRQNANTKSSLDDISGIGAKRKKALLLHFGSAKSVEQAGIADLQKVDGISEHIAETIYNHFHDN